ncbi:MAG TPA: methyltransferase domain-containing protein [Blastocatellia bacterium]|nr:methyltransferase domain-containing protein [Blastocatellia bacterium]
MSPDQPNNQTASEKQWNTSLYDGKHSFVWKYGEGVIELLEPRQGERILDLGCGTGHLTSRIAAAGATVVGIDKSPAMIESARKAYPELEFIESDGTTIGFSSEFDAVFSNATIHWVKDQAALASAIWRALKPGGRFVAEFGGKGNLSAVREALKRALSNIGHHGATAGLERYYPSVGEYATLLESAGFRVTQAIHFERPTRLENGERGLSDWLATFADNVLNPLTPEERNKVILNVESQLRSELFRDGSWFADYRRIRIVAIKKQLDT